MAKSDTTIENPPSLQEISDAVKDPAGAAAGVTVKIGERLRLSAVHCDMEHPFTQDVITQGGEKRYEIDAWLKLQVEAGKITIVND